MSPNFTIFGREYPRRYDAIVIGAGIGGLFCANMLAAGGMKVLLLERHYMLGGFCSTFRRKGFIFDAATHFYPLLGNPTTLTGKIVRDLQLPTEWIKMDPVDQFHLPGQPAFSVPSDFIPYVERLKEWFPDERANIDAYFAELKQAYMYGLLYYFRGVANDQVEKLEKYSMVGKLNEHFGDPRLKTLLMGDAPHWGSSPERTSYVFDAMLRLSYFLGNYYPKGSSQKFADDLGLVLTQKGGKILKCAEVNRILTERGKCKGVRIRTVSKRDPEEFEFEAPVVVSNGDALHTYRDLIGDSERDPWLLDHIRSQKPTFACCLTHIGLRGMDPGKLAEAEGYYWNECDSSDIMKNVFKIFVPTHFDPDIAPPGCQILITQRPSPVVFDQVTDWPAHKAELEGRTMARLRELLPGIDDRIVVKSTASAMTSYRFTNNLEGGMLGWEMSPGQLGQNRLPVYTPVDNLYLTGHWTQPGGGITPVIVSAQRVAKIILTGREEGRDVAASWVRIQCADRSLTHSGCPHMKALDADQQRAVLDGAMQLFTQYDLKDISLDKLSKHTGVAAFDILRQYHSSDNILKAVLERELELMAAAAQAPELRMPGETFGDELHVLAGVILDQYRKRLPFLAKMMKEAMDNPKVGTLFYSTFIVQGRLLFTEFLSVRKDHSELRDEVDVEAAAAMFLASLTGMFITYEILGGRHVEPLDDERILGQMCEIFLRGVIQKMNVSVTGFDGPLARATKAALERRGHTLKTSGAECAVYFPGDPAGLEALVNDPNVKRLVVRSSGYAYGANPKNPGIMMENRISLLPPADPAQRWLQAEEIAGRHANSAIIRMANVLDPAEGDLLVTKLASKSATTIAGRNPNVQFIAVDDAAKVLAAACESSSKGLFNAAGAGAMPLADAFRAAGTRQISAPEIRSLDALRYNWTLSSDRAKKDLDWAPEKTSLEAFTAFLAGKPGAHPERIRKPYDDWGLDLDYIRNWGAWFSFLRNVYWRIDHEGMENIPATGRAIFISNHRGFMPLDAVMHLSLIFTHRNRVPRFLIIPSLLRTPFMCNFLTKLGGVVASQENAARLFEQESLIGLFPEGIRGTFTPYKRTHKLRDFSRSEYATLSVRYQAPIIPTAVIGHAEIFPIIGRIDSSWVVRELGWPYLPIAPMFPLAPVPLPSKWHVRVLKPVPFEGLKPADADNERLMKEFSRHVQNIMQKNIDDMVSRRKSLVMGHFLDGTSPAIEPFRARSAMTAETA